MIILLIQGKIEGNLETETADIVISGIVEGNVKHKGLDDQDNDRDIYIYDTGVVYGDVITNDSDVELIGEVRGNIVTDRGNVDVWSQNANRRRVRNREIDRGTCRGSITTNHGDIDISEGEVHGSIKTNSGNVDNVFGVLEDRLIIMSGNNLDFATVLQRLQVNSDIPEDSVNGGDLCYIVSNSAEVISSDIDFDDVSSSWFVSSPNTSVSSYSTTGRTVNDASCRILGVGEGVHSISQRLEGTATDNLSYGVFYRLSLNLSAESSIDNVMVWISGNEFGDEGFTVEQVDTNEDEYSYVFAITSNSRITDDDILYVNIVLVSYSYCSLLC
mgnify:CR=1 FL=1